MSLRVRLLGVILFVAAVPLAASAWMALHIHQRAFNQQVREVQSIAVRNGARAIAASLDHTTTSLRLLVEQVEWPRLSDEERQGALWLAYRQADEIAAVALLDERGQPIGPPAFEFDEAAKRAEPLHPALPKAILARLLEDASRANVSGAQHVALADVVFVDANRTPLLPIRFSVPGVDGASAWSIVVAVSLRGLCAELSGTAAPRDRDGGRLEFLLLDQQSRPLCPGPDGIAIAVAEPALLSSLAAGATVSAYSGAVGPRMQYSTARLSWPPWRVVAQLPESVALAPGARIRTQALVAIAASLLLALGLGLPMAASVGRRVRRLVAGAGAIADGKLDHRLDDKAPDELGHLSRAFNAMSEQLQDRDREIRAWNQELQQRVDAQTSELREAQAQLARSQSLAVMHSLGAGVAHELNNPLTSLLGLTQILMRLRKNTRDDPEARLLAQIHIDGIRMMAIVEKLRAITRDFAGAGFEALDLEGVLDDVIRPIEGDVTRQGISVHREVELNLPKVPGDRSELVRALCELVKNSIAAMPAGGRLTFSAHAVEGRAVVVEVRDTGTGIPSNQMDRILDPFFTTKPQGSGEGLGLSLAHSIVTHHHGQLKVESTLGVGTTVRLTLPVAGEAHLV